VPAAVPICASPHPPRRVTLEGRRTKRKGIAMSNPTTANIWPTVRYRDASAAITFLEAAFGFDVAAKYATYDDPTTTDHSELRSPAERRPCRTPMARRGRDHARIRPRRGRDDEDVGRLGVGLHRRRRRGGALPPSHRRRRSRSHGPDRAGLRLTRLLRPGPRR